MHASRYWSDWECGRKSGNYAAALTFGLVVALNAALLWPLAGKTIAVPKGDMPLAVEIRRVAPPRPVMELPSAPKDDTRKLLSEVATPESLVVPEPPEPPKPVQQQEKPKPVVPRQAKPKPQKKTIRPAPAPVAAPAQPMPVQEAATEPAATAAGAMGHASGQEGVQADRKGEALAMLLHAVEKNKRYPRHARRTGQEGKVTLRVRINQSGKVAACSLAQPSGVSSLDEATEKLGEHLIGLDIPPARGLALEVLIPVHYALQR